MNEVVLAASNMPSVFLARDPDSKAAIADLKSQYTALREVTAVTNKKRRQDANSARVFADLQSWLLISDAVGAFDWDRALASLADLEDDTLELRATFDLLRTAARVRECRESNRCLRLRSLFAFPSNNSSKTILRQSVLDLSLLPCPDRQLGLD